MRESLVSSSAKRGKPERGRRGNHRPTTLERSGATPVPWWCPCLVMYATGPWGDRSRKALFQCPTAGRCPIHICTPVEGTYKEDPHSHGRYKKENAGQEPSLPPGQARRGSHRGCGGGREDLTSHLHAAQVPEATNPSLHPCQAHAAGTSLQGATWHWEEEELQCVSRLLSISINFQHSLKDRSGKCSQDPISKFEGVTGHSSQRGRQTPKWWCTNQACAPACTMAGAAVSVKWSGVFSLL